MRGRVMAFYMMMFMGGTAFGAPLIGALAEVFGARWSLIGGGLITLVGTAGAALILVWREGLLLRDVMRVRRSASIPDQLENQRITDVAQRP